MALYSSSGGFSGKSGNFGSPSSWSDGVSNGTVGSFGQGNNPFAGSLGRDPAAGQAPSARRASEEYKGLVAADKAGAGTLDTLKKKTKSPSPVKHGSSGGSSAKQSWSYYEAPIAEYYGFGKATAYQEALANTAYRREMTDMRKAGLNPSVIYGSHNSSGADSSIIPRSSSGGGGGGGRRRSYGKASQNGISKTAYYGIQLAATGIGAMLGGRGGAFVGATVGRTAAQLIGSLF